MGGAVTENLVEIIQRIKHFTTDVTTHTISTYICV
jgi:hypothetical protein